jgi:CRP/FNR family cyclic AMP-dependent transcriptional regulator
MAQDAIARALAAVPFLRGLGVAERATVAERAERRDYPEGATIVAQDDAGRALYVILAGRVRVVRHAEGVAVPLAEFGPGEFFGEMALLDGRPRSASVVATDDTQCLVLHRWDFLRELRKNPEIAVGMLSVLSGRIRATNEALGRPE